MNQEKTISRQELTEFYEPLLKGYSESFKTKINTIENITKTVFNDANEVTIDQLKDFCHTSNDNFLKSMIDRLIGVREIIYCRENNLELKMLAVWRLISNSIRLIPSEFTISSIGSQGFLSIPLYKTDKPLEAFDFIRLHIWDDSLDKYMDLQKCEDFSIHSHTFFAKSWIITGQIINNRYEFDLNSSNSKHSFFEVVYNDSLNQVNQHSSKAVNKGKNAELIKVSEEIHYESGYYEIKPSKLHKSGHKNSPLCSATFFSFTGKDGLGKSFVIGPKEITESEINRKMNIDPIYLLDKIDKQL
ncbi:hypothetical protein P872_13520 [Rhodonellum psychrophilum GCM71 = DSM 17998]|uniref:Uncharacterized protein n=2 Tax=Rhodonellum TaxID=336827 RepID=U5BWI7_9BACT|nr:MULTISPECIES: hypothetical protein [Rhodonellum]ERM80292.1 hypothetical protein P872_13520 [Rhodonellum psychrophilum GCM71 = DSM 17998]SDZ21156.1 hypothetical protein SAMN05444412_107219 [Rhodonellum ikkaensis]